METLTPTAQGMPGNLPVCDCHKMAEIQHIAAHKKIWPRPAVFGGTAGFYNNM